MEKTELERIHVWELNKLLELHKKWLNDEPNGKQLALEGYDLSGCDLRGYDLRECWLRRCDMRRCDLTGCDLSESNLSESDLTGCDLRGSNLSGCNLDFSCLPLWCGSLTAHFDDRQLRQIAYHLVRAGLNSKNASAETKTELAKLIDFANQFHRVEECGKIGKQQEV